MHTCPTEGWGSHVLLRGEAHFGWKVAEVVVLLPASLPPSDPHGRIVLPHPVEHEYDHDLSLHHPLSSLS